MALLAHAHNLLRRLAAAAELVTQAEADLVAGLPANWCTATSGTTTCCSAAGGPSWRRHGR
jgi:hypothetical protein